MRIARGLFLGACGLLLAVPSRPAEKPQINVQEFQLRNGMRWLLFETHQSPTVAAGWVAHVGSVDEREGITGISHLFEHMMFKGTKTIGTKNIALDLELIAEQERVRDEMRGELKKMRERLRKGEIDDVQKPENQTERYKALEKEFDVLVRRQRDNIIKDQLDQIYTRNGGEGLNAQTSEDSTIYFVKIPKNRVELWAWLESDRLLNPVFREFYSERDVVYEERRRSVESTPLGKYDEAFSAAFWEAHPYRWPVLGWPSDVAAITKPQADEYYGVHYAPNNLTGVLVGDFLASEVRPLIDRYFGRIPRGKADPPEVVTLEPPQLGEKRFSAYADTSPTVRIWWHAVPFVHKDRAALDLLSDILLGRTGRLYKGLVLGRKVANETSAFIDPKRYAGLFGIECVAKEGKDPAVVEAAVYEEIERLQKEPVPAEELQKVKNEAKANAYRRLSSPFFIALQLLIYDGLGDWRYINRYAEEADAVTAGDLRRVAQEYLTRDNRTVGVFLRKPSSGQTDPGVASLASELRQGVQEKLLEIASEGDPSRLEKRITGLKVAAESAPPQVEPAIDLMLERARSRLLVLKTANVP